MRTLYVSDLDGTLLDADSRIDPESATIISDLSRRGALITVATARTPATVTELLRHTYTTVPALVMTGAAVWNRQANCYDSVEFIPEELNLAIASICERVDLPAFVYTLPEDTSVMQVFHRGEALTKAENNFYQERRGLALKHFNLYTPPPPALNARTILYFAVGPIKNIYAAGRAIADTTPAAVSFYSDIYNPGMAMLEVFAPGVSKASAIERLRLQLGADRLVVFGDNSNDLSMMALADVAIAVDNAIDHVRESADIVIGPNTAASVAHWIAEDFSTH